MARASMKWFKRLSLVLACLLVLLGIGGVIAWRMLRGTPSWYPQAAVDPAAQQAAAVRAENEVQRTIDWAATQQAEERARLFAGGSAGDGSSAAASRNAATNPSTAPATAATRPRSALTVRFTEQELNAAFAKWEAMYDWRDKYGDHVSDPRIVLHEGRVILAGAVKDLGTIVSLHFEPRLDEADGLSFELVRVLGGRLPLPESVFDKHRRRLEAKVRSSLPSLQQGAKIAPDGSANDKAVAAAMARLLLRI